MALAPHQISTRGRPTTPRPLAHAVCPCARPRGLLPKVSYNGSPTRRARGDHCARRALAASRKCGGTEAARLCCLWNFWNEDEGRQGEARRDGGEMTVETSTREWIVEPQPAVLPHTPDPTQLTRLTKAWCCMPLRVTVRQRWMLAFARS
jgi:hypothetical protein